MEIKKETSTTKIGSMTDGSDFREIPIYNVTVTDGGKIYFKIFDHDPLESEISITEFEDITPISETDTTQTMSGLDAIDAMFSLAKKVKALEDKVNGGVS